MRKETLDVVLVETNPRIREIVVKAFTQEDITCIVVSNLESTLDKKGRCLIIGTPILQNPAAYVMAITRFRVLAGPKVMVMVHSAVWRKQSVFRLLFGTEHINLTPILRNRTSGLISKVRAVIGTASET